MFKQVLIHTRGLMGELACNLPALAVTAVLALPNLHIIADASGGLHILDSRGSQVSHAACSLQMHYVTARCLHCPVNILLPQYVQHSWRLRPINCGSRLSVAVALCFIPSSGTSNGPHTGHHSPCFIESCTVWHLICLQGIVPGPPLSPHCRLAISGQPHGRFSDLGGSQAAGRRAGCWHANQ